MVLFLFLLFVPFSDCLVDCFDVGVCVITETILFALYRNLQREQRATEMEVILLKRQLNSNNQWLRRYLRRTAMLSNLILGLWIFSEFFVNAIKDRKHLILKV